MTGLNAIANWTLTGLATLTYTSTHSLSVTGFETFVGGSAADTLTFAALSAAQAVTVAALGTVDGFDLTTAYYANGLFRNINSLVGGSGADSLSGLDAASTWAFGATDTYTSGGVSLLFSAIETLLGGSAADSFVFGAGKTFAGIIDG